jgi:hypothetical protein
MGHNKKNAHFSNDRPNIKETKMRTHYLKNMKLKQSYFRTIHGTTIVENQVTRFQSRRHRLTSDCTDPLELLTGAFQASPNKIDNFPYNCGWPATRTQATINTSRPGIISRVYFAHQTEPWSLALAPDLTNIVQYHQKIWKLYSLLRKRSTPYYKCSNLSIHPK